MKSVGIWSFLVAVAIDVVAPVKAETTIPSMLECSAFSKNPEKNRRFTVEVPFSLNKNKLTGERKTGNKPGKEVLTGTLGPDRLINISGSGSYFGKQYGWKSKYSGSITDGSLTFLKGSLDSNNGGHRDCKITFLVPSDQLSAQLFPSVEPVVRSSQAQALPSPEKPNTQTANVDVPPSMVESQKNAPTLFKNSPVFGRRVALVIGNSDYKNVPVLPNPANDAAAVAKALEAVGFQSVTLKQNMQREQLVDALRAFARVADNADWAVVYYAGHGIEAGGVNYLIPTDAKLMTDRDVGLEAVPIDQVLNAAERAHAMRLVILDACRDNPFADQMKRTMTVASRSVTRGLARVEPDPGTLVVFAAKAGETALDGDNGHSPFATAFVKDIQSPDVEVRRLFDNVRDDVMDATGRRQQPYSYGSVPGRQDFYFSMK